MVENDPLAPIGRLGGHLGDHATTIISPAAGDTLPPPEELDAAVILGGRMGAYQTETYPWLTTEIRWLSQLIDAETPTLGICLGAQLLAAASGGRAFPAESPEVGIVKLFKTGAGAKDPVFSDAGEIALAVHGDTFELGPSAVLLAESSRFAHAFRVGRALGVQFHPETSAETAVGWLTRPDNEIRHGLSPQLLASTIEDIRRADRERAANSDRLFASWLATVDQAL